MRINLFNKSLSSKITKLKRKYEDSNYICDCSEIICSITKWADDTYTYSIATYCNDLSTGGYDKRQFLVEPQKCSTFAEADSKLTLVVANAASHHPLSKFYKTYLDPIDSNRKQQIYSEGMWHNSNYPIAIKRCSGCGKSVANHDSICPNCGEPIY